MKMMVNLAILCATLLLLAGVAFAFPPCDDEDCYEVKVTNLDNPAVVMPPFFSKICLVYGDKIGKAETDLAPGPVYLSLFFDPLGLKILAYVDSCVGSFKFHGSDNNVITGIGFCEGDRWTVWGHKTDWDNCTDHLTPP